MVVQYIIYVSETEGIVRARQPPILIAQRFGRYFGGMKGNEIDVFA